SAISNPLTDHAPRPHPLLFSDRVPAYPALHSLPTRRSSDLQIPGDRIRPPLMRWRTVFAFRLLILAAHQSGAHAVGVVVVPVVVVAVRVDVPDVVGAVRVRRAGPPVGARTTARTLRKPAPPPPPPTLGPSS